MLLCATLPVVLNLTRITALALLAALAWPGHAGARSGSRPRSSKAAAPALLGVDPALASPGLPRLPDKTRQLLAGVGSDPPPESLTRNSHFWVSNEHHHAVWHDAIKGLGGVHLGVGTDQNFLLAGWSRASVLVLMDFDGSVPLLHRIYGLFFTRTGTPRRFLERWNESRAAESKAMIRQALAPDAPRLARRLDRIYTVARPLIRSRLRQVIKAHDKKGIPTFLTDQAQYDHLRALWQQGRVFALRGDLTGKVTVRGLARAMRLSGLQLGVLYLSNAEQYFDYGPDFRRNIIELPWATRGVTLRTLAWGCHGLVSSKDMYHYNRQAGRNFSAWMAHNTVLKAGRLLHRKTASGIKGVSVLDRAPPRSRISPILAPAARQ